VSDTRKEREHECHRAQSSPVRIHSHVLGLGILNLARKSLSRCPQIRRRVFQARHPEKPGPGGLSAWPEGSIGRLEPRIIGKRGTRSW
jgi:hypothetical protein